MAILAAIDENERSRQVVTVAHELAIAFDEPLVALHVVPTEDYEAHREAITEIPEFRDFSIDQEAESAERFAREFVTATADGLDPVRLDARGRVGKIAEEILAEAGRIDPRYLVISGRRRSPVGKAIFGNTAQQVLLNADCPVVAKLSDT